MSMRPGVEAFHVKLYNGGTIYRALSERCSWSIVVLFPSINPHFHFAVDRYPFCGDNLASECHFLHCGHSTRRSTFVVYSHNLRKRRITIWKERTGVQKLLAIVCMCAFSYSFSTRIDISTKKIVYIPIPIPECVHGMIHSTC